MSDLAPGAVLGDRFEIVGILGRGGTAAVWLAFDRVRGERVALKVLHEHLGAQAAMRSRLRREVQAAGRLRHPAALVAFDLHEVGGRLALAMPLHPGRTLQHQVQADGPLTAAQLESLATAILGALAEAHRHGVVHRDVTPANILVDASMNGVLTDFGLAATGDGRTATATGALGTSGYAAPEIWQGERADPRIDLYGLGATLYFAATGKGPFDAPTPMGSLQRQLADERVPLARARPDLPAWLAAEIECWFAREPARRPSGANDALARLSGRRIPPSAPIATLGRRALPKPVGLASGTWRVVVREPSRQKPRRRSTKRARQQAGIGGAIGELAERASRGLGDMLGLPAPRDPEEALADAVAEVAGLPPGALQVPDALYERKFLLVDGVSRRVAESLARRARALGFRAGAVERGKPGQKAPMYMVVGALAIWTGSDGGVYAGLPFVLGALLLVLAAIELRHGVPLPVAYPDLWSEIRPVAASVAGQVAPPPPPLAVATPRPPTVADTVLADLDGLRAALDMGKLPDAAASELRRTVKELRERAVALAESVRVREDALRRDGPGTEAAIQRLADRLERLRTLERAGEPVDRGELARLDATLASRQADEDDRAADEQVLARQLGELLEIGATAARTRRALLDQDEPLESVARLREQLREQARATGAARDEVRSRRRIQE